MPPRLQMSNIAKRFGNTIALDGVSLHVAPGEVLALVGENGAGKSTLMKVLSGAHEPNEGSMQLDGKPYSPRDPLDARQSGVAMIYQELSLAMHLSVGENIFLGVEPHLGPLVKWGEVNRRAREALQVVGRPDIDPKTLVSKLSIAERQLVEIGRAVAVGCRVLVLDEPTSSLAKGDIAKLFALIRQLKAKGIAIVYISHFLEEVSEISDRITVLRDGKTVGDLETKSATHDQIIAMMVGRNVESLYPRSNRLAGDVILSISGLAGMSKPARATLELRRGEVVGVAGLVGAGRTEFLRAIFGLDKIRSGEIKVHTFTGKASPAQRWQQRVGMVSEDRKVEGLALDLSIAENMTMADQPMIVTPRWLSRMSREWIKTLAIKCRGPHEIIGKLSGGNQQKVAIGRLLHSQADILLLDEPTRGIDVNAKALIYKTIDQLACQGKAVLMVSSYLPELMGTCDRIAVMSRGLLHPARNVTEITEHDIMAEATASA